MDVTALKTVLHVRAHGSIAGAARALDMDPSSVSRVVASVETGLGIRLFHRTTRRLSLTEEGQTYLQRVAPLVEELDAAAEDAAGARTRPAGHLRITASVAFSCKMLVPLLTEFHERYPNITTELQSNDANLDLVENGIDLAIRLAPAPKGDLVSTRLIRTRYKVVASPDNFKARGPCAHPSDLAGENCLRYALPGLQSVWRFRRSAETAFEVPVQGSPLISNALALRQAAVEGLGVALLADWLIDQDLRAGHLIELFPNYQCTATDFETAAWLLYPNRSYLPRKVRVMIDYLKARVGPELRSSE